MAHKLKDYKVMIYYELLYLNSFLINAGRVVARTYSFILQPISNSNTQTWFWYMICSRTNKTNIFMFIKTYSLSSAVTGESVASIRFSSVKITPFSAIDVNIFSATKDCQGLRLWYWYYDMTIMQWYTTIIS